MENKKCIKKTYATRKLAKALMKQQNTVHHFENKLNNVYYCEICSCWHITSMSKKKSRSINHRNNKKLK